MDIINTYNFSIISNIVKTTHFSIDSYHNFNHLINVSKTVNYLCIKNNLDNFTTISLVYAGLFHDYKYCGNIDDSINIDTSIKFFYDFIEKNFPVWKYDNFMNFNISRNILYTNNNPNFYPVKIDDICFELIRDATKLASLLYFNKETAISQYEAFSKEKTFLQFLKNYKSFYDNIKFYNLQARNIFNYSIDRIDNKIDCIISRMKNNE